MQVLENSICKVEPNFIKEWNPSANVIYKDLNNIIGIGYSHPNYEDFHFYYLVEKEDLLSRYLVAEISYQKLNDYLFKKITFLELLLSTRHGLFYVVDQIDTNNTREIKQVLLINGIDIPKDYFPHPCFKHSEMCKQ